MATRKPKTKRSFLLSLIAAGVLLGAGTATAKLSKGDSAPGFTLQSATGGEVSSKSFSQAGITVLAFLSLDSKPSRELAILLADLVKRRGKEGFAAVAVAGDPADKIKEFAEQQSLGYPFCADPARQTLRQYGAEQIVPMIYVIDPEGRIASVVPGGGIAAQKILLAVAEKEFARGNAEVASALFQDAAKQDPKDARARAGVAFALVKAGKLERAEEEFRGVSTLGGDAAGIAAEGLAEVRLRKGDLDGALAEAAKAPKDGGFGDVIRGEVAARRGQIDEAKKQFQVASTKQFAFDWQRAVSFNNLARITRESGDNAGAIKQYDKAIAAEPFLVEARSNKGVTLEKAGRKQEAQKTLATARTLNPSDQIITTLLKRIEQEEREKVDLERQKLVRQLVDDLVAAWKSGKPAPRPEDDWAPRALVVSFLDLRTQLPLEREGLADAFVLNLTRRLQESGRIKVVEREIIDKLLSELKLGSSELADPSTRLKLGRVLAASVIGTGGFYPGSAGSQLQLRLIDTETTDIRSTLSEDLANVAEVATFAEKLADRIAGTLKAEYPLRGKIASVDGNEIVVGVGRKHGAQTGLQFQVVTDGEPVKVDGEVVGHRQKTIGKLELTKVEDGFAYAKPVSGNGFAEGQHVLEAKP